MKPHRFSEMLGRLVQTARQYHNFDSLRERLVQVICDYIPLEHNSKRKPETPLALVSLQSVQSFDRALNEIARLRKQRRTLAAHLQSFMGLARALRRAREVDAQNRAWHTEKLERQVLRLTEERDHLREQLEQETRISRQLLDDAAKDLAAAREQAFLAAMLQRETA